jgi:hypothetical protein
MDDAMVAQTAAALGARPCTRFVALAGDRAVRAVSDAACISQSQQTPAPASAAESADVVHHVLHASGTLSPFMPVEAFASCFQELAWCNAIASGGMRSGVFACQAARAGIEHMVCDGDRSPLSDRVRVALTARALLSRWQLSYPEKYPYCNLYLFPFLLAMHTVPGQKMPGAAGKVPPFCLRQANGIMTLTHATLGYHTDALSSFDLNKHLSPEQHTAVDAGTLLLRVRAMWAAAQGTALRMPGGVSGGRDWEVQPYALPGGGTFMAESVRCSLRDEPTRLAHRSLTSGMDGEPFGGRQQLLIDPIIFNPIGTERLCQQFALVYATGAVQRRLRASAPSEADGAPQR